MDFLEQIRQRLTGSKVRIVFPEGTEARILLAVEQLMPYGFLHPILLGCEENIRDAAARNGVDLNGMEIVDPDGSPLLEKYCPQCCEALKIPNASIAKVFLRKPNNFGAFMLRSGDADTFVSGAVTATSEVVAANKLVVGFDEGISVVSGLMIMDIPGYEGSGRSILAVSDPAINIDPTAEALADIAIASAKTAQRLLGRESRVAMLSFSTHGSGAHPKVDLVVRAAAIAKEKAPGLKVDGELQLDAALVPDVAKVKLKETGEVAGRANTLIFPELNSANIGAKLIQRIGHADAYGAVVQGLKRPLCDLSRGATVKDIQGMITIMAAIANSNK